MRKILLACIVFTIATDCKNKHAPLAGQKHVDMKDFIEVFRKITLPYRVADTNLAKIPDTTIISHAVFTEFVPDTVLVNMFGKSAEIAQINPVGKIEKDDELYLLVNVALNKKITLVTFLFDKKNKYISHLELVKESNKDNYVHSVN